MSCCRFSSAPRCDVYCYETGLGGYVIHVAKNYYKYFEPIPQPKGDSVHDYLEVFDILKTMKSEIVPIGLCCDGETFCVETPHDAADTLAWLKEQGYHVPQSAIDTLNNE